MDAIFELIVRYLWTQKGQSESLLYKIPRENTVASPLMPCLPPTLVGGQRTRNMFRGPASAGLLEELKSPAEAGSRVICRSSNHQLKLVANRKHLPVRFTLHEKSCLRLGEGFGVEVVAFHLLVEGGAVDFEGVGGGLPVPVVGAEGGFDDVLFRFLQSVLE